MTDDRPSSPGSARPAGRPVDPEREPIYRLVRRLMLFDLLLGVVLFAIVGPIWHIPGLQIAGALLAAIGLALYVFFGRLAARQRARGGG
jgi:Flp pilus assembly protein TadB